MVTVIRKAEDATARYDAMTLTIAVAYGGREEIADAVRDLIRAKLRDGLKLDELAEHVTPETIDRHLYTAGLPEPDLIIRTSGEVRLSGFLLWQSVHSEFYFTDVYWPEFRKVDFPARDSLVPTEDADALGSNADGQKRELSELPPPQRHRGRKGSNRTDAVPASVVFSPQVFSATFRS